jgi:hypothetical protein
MNFVQEIVISWTAREQNIGGTSLYHEGFRVRHHLLCGEHGLAGFTDRDSGTFSGLSEERS